MTVVAFYVLVVVLAAVAAFAIGRRRMRASGFDDVILAGVAILVALAMTFRSCEVEAQARRPRSDEETLAALCVHEADFDSPGDCWGIFAVLANIAEARGTTWQRAIRLHSPRFSAGTSSRPWASALRDTDAPPRESMGAGWRNERCTGPTTPERPLRTCLPSRRERFRDLVVLCYEIIHTPPVCAATTWGNARDYREGRFAREHAHDVFVDCSGGAGSTRNLFSHAPGEP